MTIETQKFARKPFVVDASKVTKDNIKEVAEWCGGTIRTARATALEPEAQYIKVDVKRPLNTRQTQAFEGDWVLEAGTGFKVYTDRAFENSFEPVLEEDEGVDESELNEGKNALVELLDMIESQRISLRDAKVALGLQDIEPVLSEQLTRTDG